MKRFDNAIVMREEFFYEVLLPFLGANGWNYDCSQPPGQEVMLEALQNPDGESQKRHAANELIDNLLKGATLSPFYVYHYRANYHRDLAGRWEVQAATGIAEATEVSNGISDMAGVSAVNIYKNTETMKAGAWTRAKRGFRPFKARFVQIDDFLDVGVWEYDEDSYEAAANRVMKLRGELSGVGAVYVRIGAWTRGE